MVFVFNKSLDTVAVDYSLLMTPHFMISFGGAFLVVLGGSMMLPANYGRLLYLVSDKKIDNSFRGVISVYCKTQIFKYLPGNVFHFVGRQLFLKELSFRQTDIANTTLGEILGLASAATLICVILGRNELNDVISTDLLVDPKLFIGVLSGLVLGVSIWLRYFLKQRRVSVPFSQIALTGFIYAMYFLATSVALWIILKAFGINASFSNTTIIFVLAWLIGFVTPGSSAGIGLREATIFTLGNYLLGENLSLIALILRLITVMGDGGQWSIGYYLGRSATILSDKKPINPDF